MDVTLFDIRNIQNAVPGLKFAMADVQTSTQEYIEAFDSVSSLHAIEHFGLGRYGDPLSTEGHINGLINISMCVKKGGYLYLSFPVGKDEIHFNAQRVLKPDWPLGILTGFLVEEVVLIPWRGEPVKIKDFSEVDENKLGQAILYRFKRFT